VHVRTYAGDTCLHLAAKHEASAAMICLLIKAGADLHAVNSEGRTPAQVAHDRGNTFIEQLLIRAAQQRTLAAVQQHDMQC
jgi:ankyrin repeat protein